MNATGACSVLIIINFASTPVENQITIGEFVFDRSVFQDLIQYIWVGGFPRWKENLRPDYVQSMKEKIDQSQKHLFEGLTFTLP